MATTFSSNEETIDYNYIVMYSSYAFNQSSWLYITFLKVNDNMTFMF